MSKPKIKFKLIKLERALVFQVLEQDERFRRKSHAESAPMFVTSSGVTVQSIYESALSDSEIYLRGADGNDFRAYVVNYKDNDKRDKVFARTIEALMDWSKNAPQFAEDKAAPKTTEPDTYEF
jgi:acid stress-induced BolA-like protein IbaG/YrbA